jgi:hypothetical protein
MIELGELQIKILKHMLSCDSAADTVSHISRNINALQPAVFVSTKAMVEKGILTKKGNSPKGKKKELSITDKGIATAILVGIKHRKLDEYIESTQYRDEYSRQRHKLFIMIMELVRTPARRNLILNRALEYMLTHGWYDEEKKILNQNDRIYLFTHLIPYIFTYPTEAGSVIELIDKFGIDRKVFWNMLLDKLASSIEIINRYGKYIIHPGPDNFSTEFFIDLWEDFFRRYKRKVQKFDGSWTLDKPNTPMGDHYHEIRLMPSLDTVTLVIDYNDIRAAAIHQKDSIAGLSGEYKYTIYDHLARQIERQADEARNCARLALFRLVDKDYLEHHKEMIRVEFSSIVSSPSSSSPILDNEFHLRKMREMIDELKVLTELINKDILHLKKVVENEKKVESIK